MLGRIVELNVLALLIAMIGVMAAALALITISNPPAPPYSVSLQFRQVRIKLGITGNITAIDNNYHVGNGTTVEVGYLLPLELHV